MASSRSAWTAVSSPIASPGSRSPPSPGVTAAAVANALRTGTAQASHTGGGSRTSGVAVARRVNVVASPGSFERTDTSAVMTAPSGYACTARASPGTTSDPGTPPPTCSGRRRAAMAGPSPVSAVTVVPRSRQRSTPSNPAPDRRGELSTRTATSTLRCSRTAASSCASVRCGACTAITVAPSAATARATATVAYPPPRRKRCGPAPMRRPRRASPRRPCRTGAPLRRLTRREAQARAAIASTAAQSATAGMAALTPIPMPQHSHRAAAGPARRRSGIRQSPCP